MDLREFHNLLRVMRNIDQHEVPFLTAEEWVRFRDNPYNFFIRCDDATCYALWTVMIGRVTPRVA